MMNCDLNEALRAKSRAASSSSAKNDADPDQEINGLNRRQKTEAKEQACSKKGNVMLI